MWLTNQAASLHNGQTIVIPKMRIVTEVYDNLWCYSVFFHRGKTLLDVIINFTNCSAIINMSIMFIIVLTIFFFPSHQNFLTHSTICFKQTENRDPDPFIAF